MGGGLQRSARIDRPDVDQAIAAHAMIEIMQVDGGIAMRSHELDLRAEFQGAVLACEAYLAAPGAEDRGGGPRGRPRRGSGDGAVHGEALEAAVDRRFAALVIAHDHALNEQGCLEWIRSARE